MPLNFNPFKKKGSPRIIEVDGRKIELQPKPKKGLFGGSQKAAKQPTSPSELINRPSASTSSTAIPAQQPQQPTQQPTQQGSTQAQRSSQQPNPTAQQPQKPTMQQRAASQQRPKRGFLHNYIQSVAFKHPKLEDALTARGVKESATDFIRRMLLSSIMMGVLVGAMIIIVLQKTSISMPIELLLGALVAIAVYRMMFGMFLNYPAQRGRKTGKGVERDILFAVRDIIISLRSGMPLYNAITSVSTGYGDASAEFKRIVEMVQVGIPLGDAIDRAIAETGSSSFRRVMLQASVSIKSGSDVISALQSAIDQLSQERIIELRRYGQRLNALAMFYMLFGVILPSMGIAVATILTTFISLFTITPQLLYGALVAILFLQVIFLNIIRSSRPVFTM
ncbi:type II secretion system F family protein [Candidatus Marsarchaeota archaeon]|nr:type II secretion system F family protein [Candidatus Marsarchaeota archaeon]